MTEVQMNKILINIFVHLSANFFYYFNIIESIKLTILLCVDRPLWLGLGFGLGLGLGLGLPKP